VTNKYEYKISRLTRSIYFADCIVRRWK